MSASHLPHFFSTQFLCKVSDLKILAKPCKIEGHESLVRDCVTYSLCDQTVVTRYSNSRSLIESKLDESSASQHKRQCKNRKLKRLIFRGSPEKACYHQMDEMFYQRMFFMEYQKLYTDLKKLGLFCNPGEKQTSNSQALVYLFHEFDPKLSFYSQSQRWMN